MSRNQTHLQGQDGPISILTNEHGIPEITAHTRRDAACGLGWVHARDRQLQMLLTRILLQGRAAELLAPTPELVEIDRFMRRMNFLPDGDEEISRLTPEASEEAAAYSGGVNSYLGQNGTVFEFKLLGVRPEPWTVSDSLILGKVMAFLGLADAQGNMEKFLIQMVQKGVDEERLKELFPYLTETIDVELLSRIQLAPPPVPEVARWMQILPRTTASNNWVVSGRATTSGKPILCNDPHLEINRIPAIWYETILRVDGRNIQGVSLPGASVIAIGRSPDVSWGVTFSFMDMIDYRIEHCRNGCYRRGDDWIPFRVRDEHIILKKKGEVTERCYENEHGILEGDPFQEGYYLVMAWSAARGCGAGDFNGLASVPYVRTTEEALSCFQQLEALTFNWIAADSAGNIGYQMSGRMWQRPPGISGLLPYPGWDSAADPTGFVLPADLPRLYNPPEGYIVTANNDLNQFGKAKPINLPMAPYRALRITEMLEEKKGHIDAEWMKTMHYDLYSLQARRFMDVLRPLLPDSAEGEILRQWDCRYGAESKGACLFESVYLALLEIVFGESGFGREVVGYLMKETGLFTDYFGSFDGVLLRQESSWYGSRKREDLFRQALTEGLKARPVPYGETRMLMLSHLLFGGKFPRFFGFDRGPFSLPGNRATILQGQIFRSAGRTTTFSPSYRMIADFAEEGIRTNLVGGPSDRRFSRFYQKDFDNWLQGVYKHLI